MRFDQILKHFGLLIIGGCTLAAMGAQALAQSAGDIWTPAVNVSQSGTASNPVIATAPNGNLHAVWWDNLDGEQYARTNLTSTVWTEPVNVPQIIGRRQVDAQTNRVTLTEPRNVVLATDGDNRVHAFWFNTADQLLHAQTSGAAWSDATVLAQAATILNTATDESGALHVAYIQSADSPESPAGLYYRVNSAGNWSPPDLIHASSYFRALNRKRCTSVWLATMAGRSLQLGMSLGLRESQLAFSLNNGTDWSAPLPVSNTQSLPVQHVYVAAAPNGEFLMLWQDAGTTDCTFAQRVSNDGGQTWSAPVRVFNSAALCQQQLSFMPDSDGRLWLVGQAATNQTATGLATMTLALWDGSVWSQPTDVTFSQSDQATGRSIPLDCLKAAVAGQTVGIVGCDANRDVYAARNAVELDAFMTALQPVWMPLEVVSDQSDLTSIDGLPDVATDQEGGVYALWSQGLAANSSDTALHAITYEDNQWTQPVIVLRSPDSDNATSNQAVHPSLVIDAEGKAQAVWSAGAIGPVLYSWAYARDFAAAQSWAEPIALPASSLAGSWPDIVADPNGNDLYVAYAIPFNERRGLYLATSQNGGTTWLTPTLIFDAVAAQWDGVDKVRLALEPISGILHATWLRTTLPGRPASQEVYYARSMDRGRTWSAALRVAEGDVDWPRIAAFGSGQAYLAWNQRLKPDQADAATPYSVWGQVSD